MSAPILVRLEGLSKRFTIAQHAFSHRSAVVNAVEDVSFELARAECLGIVGESGCGKSTLGRTLVRLYQPTEGRVLIRDADKGMVDFTALQGEALKRARQRVQMVFQDPSASLNPRMTVRDILSEPYVIHRTLAGARIGERIEQLVGEVGLRPDALNRYPHQFSGGQKQRIGIARSLALEPELVVLDEPVSALDVSIRGQILNLLKDLQERRGLAYVFISHDLAAVQYVAHRIAVMYLGRIVELAKADAFYRGPRHPYSAALLSALPVPDPKRRRTSAPPRGNIPSPLAPPPGCHFHERCPFASADHRKARCTGEVPSLREVAPGRLVRCHFAEELEDALAVAAT
jgi:oligopeptide/dipeptide ABC transporter ATP-binding protein